MKEVTQENSNLQLDLKVVALQRLDLGQPDDGGNP